jgi:hypothetical protein
MRSSFRKDEKFIFPKKICGRGSNVDKGIEGHWNEAASLAGVRSIQQAADPAEFMRATVHSSLLRTPLRSTQHSTVSNHMGMPCSGTRIHHEECEVIDDDHSLAEAVVQLRVV